MLFGHCVHAAAPAAAAYVPTGHGAHDVLPGEEKLPGGHTPLHAEALAPPAAVENVPPGHGVQLVLLGPA